MEEMEQSLRDRVVAALCAAMVVGLLGCALIFGLRVGFPHFSGPQPTTLEIVRVPPPRDPPPPARRRSHAPRRAASPPNIRSMATDIVIPPPLVILPPRPVPVIAAPLAGLGASATAGASDRAGPGQGAGGTGTGTGGGGDGGDGEGEGDGTPPELIRGRLKFTDLPPELRVLGEMRSVSVRYRVGVDGRVSDCRVTRSSGNVALDLITCRSIEARFRFRPSRDADGQKVGSIVIETHQWLVGGAEPQPPT